MRGRDRSRSSSGSCAATDPLKTPLRLGIARGLVELDGEHREALKKAGFLTRDPRKKESKKYGLKKARKAPQYSKR